MTDCFYKPLVPVSQNCVVWQPQFSCDACASCTFYATFEGTEGQRLADYTPEIGTLTILGTGGIITEAYPNDWAFKPDTAGNNGFKISGFADLDLFASVENSRDTEIRLRSGAQSIQVNMELDRITVRDLDGTVLANDAYASTASLDIYLSLSGTTLTYEVRAFVGQAVLASGSVTVTASSDTDIDVIVDDPNDPPGYLFTMYSCANGVTPQG